METFLILNTNPSLGKQKFPRGKIAGAADKMQSLGQRRLRNFTARPKIQYDSYYDFSLKRERPNFAVPPLGRTIRVTDLKGNPIVLTRRKVRKGNFRVVYKKITFFEQKKAAFILIDEVFRLLS